MIKNIIILLIILSVLFFFIADFLLDKATDLYNKYHIKNVEHKNNDNIYFSMKFYDEPSDRWSEVEKIYNNLICIGLFFEEISPFILSISLFILSIYLLKNQKN